MHKHEINPKVCNDYVFMKTTVWLSSFPKCRVTNQHIPARSFHEIASLISEKPRPVSLTFPRVAAFDWTTLHVVHLLGDDARSNFLGAASMLRSHQVEPGS